MNWRSRSISSTDVSLRRTRELLQRDCDRAGVDTESLILKITPAANISGRITDEVGDPVRGAIVTLYRNIDLHPRPQAAVALTVHADTTGQGASALQLQESVFGQPEGVYGQMQVTDTGTVFVGIPPGRYILKQSNQTTGNGQIDGD